MKPDWDSLGEKFNYKSNAHIVDVDCTDETGGKNVCSTYGVSGYPTLKYFKKGGDDKGDSYEGGREFGDFKKFIQKMSKQPCNPATLENCNKKEKGFIEEIKDMDAAKIQEQHDTLSKAILELRKEKSDAEALFDVQKDEAIATQKKGEAFKKDLGKLTDKTGYKVDILAQKLPGADKKEEL